VLHLALVDLMRERERGVPRYNALRRQLRLEPLASFADLSDDLSVVAQVSAAYATVEELDLLVGCLAESPRPRGHVFGETTAHLLLAMQARRLRTDRFFQQSFNAATYTQVGYDWVQAATLSTVIARHLPATAAYHADLSSAFQPWQKITICSVHYSLTDMVAAQVTAIYTFGLDASGVVPVDQITALVVSMASSDIAFGFLSLVLVLVLGCMWLLSISLDWWLDAHCVAYHIAEPSHKRNMITYMLELSVTPILFFWNCWLIYRITITASFAEQHVLQAGTTGLVLIALYLFELLYRFETRWQLVLHHVATIVLLCVALYRFEHFSERDDSAPGCSIWIISAALLLSMTALTEQPIFAGLLAYRLGRFYPRTFFICAVQNFICKMGFILWVSVIWGDSVTQPFWWVFWPLVGWGMLLPAQMVACSVQWQMGHAMARKLSAYQAKLSAEGKPSTGLWCSEHRPS